MDSFETVASYIQGLKRPPITGPLLEKMVSVMDYTSLNDNDTEESVAHFIEGAKTTYGQVAAVCIYPAFVRMAVSEFANTPIKVATVANFPHGETDLETVLVEIGRALEDGAEELDIVFPYARYLAGDRQYAEDFVAAVRAASGDQVVLKIILESGAFPNLEKLAEAAKLTLAQGANFLKTSTGKIAKGATLEAAATLLLVIRDATENIKKRAGFKAAGGIKTLTEAAAYMALAEEIMGAQWVNPKTFRIGTSKLLEEVLKANVT